MWVESATYLCRVIGWRIRRIEIFVIEIGRSVVEGLEEGNVLVSWWSGELGIGCLARFFSWLDLKRLGKAGGGVI